MAQLNSFIFIMTSVHPWDDPRIFFKEALSLSNKYQVEIHAPADFKYRVEKGVAIFGLPKYQRRYLRFLNWVRLFFRAWKSPARYIHFHDPELIPLGIILKLFVRKKVIYDVHENFPASILTKSWIPKFIRRSLAGVLDFGEKRAVRYFNGIILAELSYLERFRDSPVLVQPILNFPPRDMGKENYGETVSNGPGRCERQLQEKNYQVKFVYAGVISKVRGIEEIIRSFGLVQKAGLDFHLFLAGSWISPDLRREMEEMIRNLHMEEQVTITGRISFQQIGDLYQQCDVGLALLHPEKNYLNSLATKIFEYMAMGIPVLASDFPLWEMLILGHQCGITANPLDIEDISKKIARLIRNECLRHRLGKNGREAFDAYYNWDTQEKKLWEFYQKLEG